MKTKHLIYLFLIITIVASCGKEDDNSPTPTVEDTAVYFRCKLNGRDFTDNTRFADYFQGTARVVSYNDIELIRMDMSKDTVGTYVINSSNANNKIKYIDSLQKSFIAISGSIIVTQFDKTKQLASGTFTGVLQEETNSNNRITLTEGKFNRVLLEPF
jgi:hypothetical protein